MSEMCVCGKEATYHAVWHAWKVDWNEIKPLLPDHYRKLLGKSLICEDCRVQIKAEIEKIISAQKSFDKVFMTNNYDLRDYEMKRCRILEYIGTLKHKAVVLFEDGRQLEVFSFELEDYAEECDHDPYDGTLVYVQQRETQNVYRCRCCGEYVTRTRERYNED